LEGTLPTFLQSTPAGGIVVELQNNYFECPLPFWCSEYGNGACAPCYDYTSFTESATPSSTPTPSSSVTPSASASPSQTANDNSEILTILLITICSALVACGVIGGILIIILRRIEIARAEREEHGERLTQDY
jgi:hypothetical protein